MLTSGSLLLILILVPLAFVLGRLSNKVAVVRVKQNRAAAEEWFRSRED